MFHDVVRLICTFDFDKDWPQYLHLYIQHTITLHLQYNRQINFKKIKHDIILYQTESTPY